MTTTQRTGFTSAEKAAMKARVEELRSSGRGGAKKAEEAQACFDAIAAMPDNDRALAERVHTLVGEAAPDLRPKTYYGMPAYADQDGKIVCFFKPGSKFGTRYATLGFNDVARLDDGEIWPTEFAVTSTSDAVATTIRTVVRRAVGTAD